MTIVLSLLAALAVWLLVCLAFWAGFAAAGRALPRPTGRHRRGEDSGWFFDHQEPDETPSPLPAGVFGFAPISPRGTPNWNRLTEPMSTIGARR